MLQGLQPYSARAVVYEKAAEKTLYGMPQGATVGERLLAIPKKHRQLVTEAIAHSSPEDRRRLAKELPSEERRIIGRQLDPEMEPEERADLTKYFQHHFLPRKHWEGWEEEESMQPALAKEIQRTGLDPADVGPMFSQQYNSGLKHPLAVGPFDTSNISGSSSDVRSALQDVLGQHFDHLDVKVSSRRGHTGGSRVNMNLRHNRSDDADNYMNTHKHSMG